MATFAQQCPFPRQIAYLRGVAVWGPFESLLRLVRLLASDSATAEASNVPALIPDVLCVSRTVVRVNF